MASEKHQQTADTTLTTLVVPAGERPVAVPSADLCAQTVALAPVAALLFCSGMCGLIFQVSWFREFRLVFGASTAASSAVLAVFMGGLGIGNAVLGRRADRARTPLVFYARLELSIAVSVALGPLLIDIFHGLYISLGGQLALGVSVATAVRLAISVLVLGIPTFLMGGTLPSAVRSVTTGEDHQRRAAALLYGMNTLGAVVGALGSTFFALEFFGTRKTLWLACLISTCTGFVALALFRRAARPASDLERSDRLTDHKSKRRHGQDKWSFQRLDSPTASQKPMDSDRRRRHKGRTASGPTASDAAKTTERVANDQSLPAPTPLYIIYAVAGLVGFAFFLMELVWYRMLGPILGGTTFTFGLILTVALKGIGLGAAAYAMLYRRASVSLHVLAFTCVLEAACIALPLALGDRLAVLAAHLRAATSSYFMGEVGGWALITAIVVLPAAFISGIQFPLLIGLLGQGEKDIGKQVGFAFSWNTLGAICGALAGGFGLLPLLTAPGVWRSVSALLAILGVSTSVYAWKLARRRVWAVATLGTGIVAVGMIACPGPTAVWRHGAVGAGRSGWTKTLADPNSVHDWENSVKRSVLWEADGVESSIAIVASDGLAFYVNGMCDGNAVADVGTQMMLGLIPSALHSQPRSAFVVGLGTGETAGWLAKVPTVERVDVVELEPAVQEMARRCREVNQDVLTNPKVQLIFNDAREVLLTTAARYDLIVCEPSNPYRNGIANLFTREFYLAGRNRLNDGGLFAQWVQTYEIDDHTMRTVFATFKSVFPHVELWQTDGGDMVLLGANQKPEYSASRLRSKLATEPYASALPRAWHTTDLEGMLSHYLGGVALVDHFIAADVARINTDDHNEIEYGCARNLGRTDWDAPRILYRQSAAIGDHRRPVNGGAVDWQAVALGRLWNAAVRDGKELSADDLALNDGASDKVLERYVARDVRGMLTAWNLEPPSAPCLTELSTIAHVFAESGSSESKPLIERLRNHLPAEADALEGILAWRQQKVSESGERLAGAIRRMHHDPWVLQHILTKTFDAAISVAKADQNQAPILLRAFEDPFAAYDADESRRATACVIAEELGPSKTARFVETFEPDVPWTKKFLSYRRKAYQDAGHPLATQAARDLQEFIRCAASGPASSNTSR